MLINILITLLVTVVSLKMVDAALENEPTFKRLARRLRYRRNISPGRMDKFLKNSLENELELILNEEKLKNQSKQNHPTARKPVQSIEEQERNRIIAKIVKEARMARDIFKDYSKPIPMPPRNPSGSKNANQWYDSDASAWRTYNKKKKF